MSDLDLENSHNDSKTDENVGDICLPPQEADKLQPTGEF